jgi:catechol 2,3-dioxygenase-like lactoylglutathione lyase family enzyme
MFDHVGIQVADVEKSARFYVTVFAPIGMREAMRFEALEHIGGLVVGLSGPDGIPKFWLSPALRPEDREAHIAFTAPDRATVDAVYEKAVAAGTEVLHEPKEWPIYHPGYYGVFLRDPDGHNVEAVYHGAP